MMPSRAPCTRDHRSAGFTLMELLTTVSIVLILFTLAFPPLTNMILTQHVRAGAADLHTALLFARSEALKRAVNIDMAPLSNNWRNGWNVQLGDGTVLRSHGSLNARLASMPVDAGTKITFRNDGRVSVAPAPIVISASSNAQIAARCVIVDLSGRPATLVDTDGNASNGCN